MDRSLILCLGLAYASLVSAAGPPSSPAFAAPATYGASKGGSLASHYSAKERRDILESHAVLGSLAWVFIIPLGAILFKVLKTPRLFWIHTAVQTLGMCLAIANFGTGVFIAVIYKKAFNNPHTIIGAIIWGLMFLQPLWGFLQHSYYKKNQAVSWWGKGHRWIGRATITLAMINGGLGFWLGRKSPSYRAQSAIAYGVGAGVTFVVWIAIIVIVDVSKSKKVVKDSEDGRSPESGSQNVSKEMVSRVSIN